MVYETDKCKLMQDLIKKNIKNVKNKNTRSKNN